MTAPKHEDIVNALKRLIVARATDSRKTASTTLLKLRPFAMIDVNGPEFDTALTKTFQEIHLEETHKKDAGLLFNFVANQRGETNSAEKRRADAYNRRVPSNKAGKQKDKARLFTRMFEEPLLRQIATQLLAAHNQGLETDRTWRFHRWLAELESAYGHRLRSRPITPVLASEFSIGGAAFAYVIPQPTFPLNVRLRPGDGRAFVFPSTSTLSNFQAAYEAEWEALATKLRVEAQEDREKLSVDYVGLPELDPGVLTIAYHVERFSAARSLAEALERDERARNELASTFDLALEGAQAWPNRFCLHGIVTFKHKGQPYILWTERKPKNNSDARDFPGTWSCSFEEQLKPSNDYEAETRRAFEEEVGPQCASSEEARLLAVIVEEKILNVSVIHWTRWNGTWENLLEDHKDALDSKEVRQLAATPLNRGMVQQLSEGGFPHNDGDVEWQPRRPPGETRTDLHPTSLSRFLLALWLSEYETMQVSAR